MPRYVPSRAVVKARREATDYLSAMPKRPTRAHNARYDELMTVAANLEKRDRRAQAKKAKAAAPKPALAPQEIAELAANAVGTVLEAHGLGPQAHDVLGEVASVVENYVDAMVNIASVRVTKVSTPKKVAEGLTVDGIEFAGPFKNFDAACEGIRDLAGTGRCMFIMRKRQVYVNDAVNPETGQRYTKRHLPQGAYFAQVR